MRMACWLFSTALVLGGVAWAVGAAEPGSSEKTTSQPAKSGRGGPYFFSKSGRTGEAAKPAAPATSRSAPAAATEDSGPAPERYTRSRTTSSGRPVKNYYDELFGEAPKSAGGESRLSDSRAERPAPSRTPAARPSESRSIESRSAESDLSDSSVESTAQSRRPTKPLRATAKATLPRSEELAADSEETEQVSHEEAVEEERPVARKPVVQAKHEATSGSEERSVKQIQHRQPAKAAASEEPAIARKPARAARQIPAETVAEETAAESAAEEPAPTITRRRVAPSAAAPVVTAAPAAAPAKAAPTTAKTTTPVKTASAAPAVAAPAAPPTTPSTRPAMTAAASRPAPAAPKSDVELTSAAASKSEVNSAAVEIDSGALSGETPVLTLRWEAHGEVSVGQECKCHLVVKNTSRVSAKDVVVEAFFPRSVRLLNAEPFPNSTQDHLTWNFESFTAHEEKSIEITMVPAKRGELATSATVRFTGSAATVMKVEEPQLKIAVKGPQEVEIGEAATQTIVVNNPGSGVARDVVIIAAIPEGLEAANKGKRVQLPIGALNPNETREIKLTLTAIGGGQQTVYVEAKGEGNLISHAEAVIKVTAPKLDIAVTGPSLRYVNRKAQYNVVVTNKGAAATNNVRVVQSLPEGFEFTRADKGGTYNSGSRQVSWFLGQIDAGQAMQLQVEVEAKEIGTHSHKFQAMGENGALAEAVAETKVDGTAALVVSVIDLDDPVEVKSQTSYEITVRNDGSKSAQSLNMTCELPRGMEVVTAEGPVAHAMDKGMLVFRAIPELNPGESLKFKVKVVSQTAGNLRFRAKLSSASVAEPIITEELTKFYAD